MSNIAKRPTGHWRARYRDAAGREHARHFDRKVDAQRWLDSVTAAVETGSYVDPRAGRITVAEWAERWLQGQAHLKPTTWARYRGILDRHVLPHWAAVQLVAVSHSDVQAWVAQQRASGAAPATVRKHFRVLSLVLELAVRDGRLPRNPCHGVNLPRPDQARRRYLTHAQVHRLAEEACRPRSGTRLPHRERGDGLLPPGRSRPRLLRIALGGAGRTQGPARGPRAASDRDRRVRRRGRRRAHLGCPEGI
jgi:hypothetical protein